MRRSTTSASGLAGATNDPDAAHLKDQSRVSGIGMTSARTRERLVARLSAAEPLQLGAKHEPTAPAKVPAAPETDDISEYEAAIASHRIGGK